MTHDRQPLPKADKFGHRTRFSDSSLYDEKCVCCGGTDAWGDHSLEKPCQTPDDWNKERYFLPEESIKFECSFCGETLEVPCRNTRDLKDSEEKRCFAALMLHGGGEYTKDRLLSEELMRRAGVKREDGA